MFIHDSIFLQLLFGSNMSVAVQDPIFPVIVELYFGNRLLCNMIDCCIMHIA